MMNYKNNNNYDLNQRYTQTFSAERLKIEEGEEASILIHMAVDLENVMRFINGPGKRVK